MNGGYLITFRSITYAQKGERLLKEMGIPCTLQRTPKALTRQGCGYCLRLGKCDIVAVMARLKSRQAVYGKLYTVNEDGSVEEWRL